MDLNIEVLEYISRIRKARIETGKKIHASYNTYQSPNISTSFGITKQYSDKTAASLYNRENLLEQYNKLLKKECACWGAVDRIPDREMKQMIRNYLLGCYENTGTVAKVKKRIAAYLSAMPS